MSLIELSEQEIQRRESLQKLRDLGIDPYPAALFPVNSSAKEIKCDFEDGKHVCIAGRMMSQRVMGKASFAELQDASGRIQIYINRDEICPGEDKTLYNEIFKKHPYLNENNEYCLVKGNRINRPFFDLFFTKSMEFIAFLFTKTFIKDINAQPKIFSKEFFLQIYNDNLPLDFSFDFYFLYHAKKNGYIKSFNVNFRTRKFDLSKGGGTFYGKLKLTKRTLTYLFNFSK